MVMVVMRGRRGKVFFIHEKVEAFFDDVVCWEVVVVVVISSLWRASSGGRGSA